jgi:hypothetical protein
MCNTKNAIIFLTRWTYDGLSDGAIDDHDNLFIGQYSNSYAILTNDSCWLAGERHQLDLPEGAIEPRWKSNGINVFGCGLVLDPEDKVWIFFTLNGQLKGVLTLRVLKIYFQIINFTINHD